MNDKLGVCLMNDSFPPIIDGVANAVINYANIISNGLGRATVVTPEYPGVVDDYPFDVIRYRSINTQKIWGYRMGYPFSSSKLDALTVEEPGIIHSHCPFASTVMARVLREKNNIPIVFTYHTKFDIDIYHAIPNKLMADRVIKFVVNNISACDEVWTVSRGAADNLRSIGYEGDIFVMENGVDFPCGRADEDDAEALRSAFEIPDDAVLFLYVGRLMWYKGIKIILDSLKILDEKNIDFRMMFVGDGLERDEMEKYAEEIGLGDKCIFTGAVYDREELRVFYTAGELFLFPSEYDTNGIVVREAAACGVGSVLLEGSCAAEGIDDGKTGIICRNDARDMAKKLEFASKNRAKLREIGENAMREVYVSWETAVKRAFDRYPAVIEKCMSGQTQRREGVIQEEFFSAIDNITDSIQRFRSIPAGIRRTNEKNREKWHKFRERIKKNK
ncbi:MAG: glycosyltransferase [Oscillospiraceae bacterium]|nr:glycosyltransferase [Oscillospiraceae bacterium]